MTFNKAAWAIDGPTINSALARTEAYAANSGSEGLVQGPDLKVAALSTPGQGIQIGAGSALILNRYQGTGTDQCYTVSNPDTHVVTSESMPGSNSTAQAYIVAVVVGDPEFSQIGHPFMPAQMTPGTEPDFTYVRPVVMLETQFNARTYPALALARLSIPANTTTVTAAMITDLRKLARPRSWLAVSYNAAPSTANPLNAASAATAERWPNVPVLAVTVPSWAVKAKVMGFVEGARLTKAGVNALQPYIEGTSLVGGVTNIDEYLPAKQGDRRAYNVGGEIDVTTIAGQTKTFSVRGWTAGGASSGSLSTDANTSVMLQVYFEEQPT